MKYNIYSYEDIMHHHSTNEKEFSMMKYKNKMK